ncbi:response regulator [Granulicella cerasi]|uniref:Response regulator n=1 Tax=Granulicella cerasi TaxID=741063 RepID=A0ABW1Z7V4_9BACT|nr:response regulator transcription factor [Granulicella cerasi]
MLPPQPITVMVVDDHPIMRSGLTSEINSQKDMRVVAEAADGIDFLEKYRIHQPDLVLLDLRMPRMNGLEALKELRQEFPKAKVVVLTTFAGDVHVQRAFQSGASGYILKNLLQTELFDTVRSVAAGQRRILPEVAAQIATHAGSEHLTARELTVLQAVAKGCSNKIIGADLGISEHTIKNHVQSILEKLGASDRTHAVTIGLQRGFIDL